MAGDDVSVECASFLLWLYVDSIFIVAAKFIIPHWVEVLAIWIIEAAILENVEAIFVIVPFL